MGDDILLGMLFLGVFVWFITYVVVTNTSHAKLNRKYNTIELGALDSYIMRKHPKTWLQMSNPEGFRMKLEKELIKDFFNEKKENPEDRYVVNQ